MLFPTTTPQRTATCIDVLPSSHYRNKLIVVAQEHAIVEEADARLRTHTD